MPRKKHVYHYVYKTTNLKTGKFYIGMHSTSNLNDGYLGSGKRLRRAIRKYGKHNFVLEIIEYLPDREALKKREKELVNEALLKDSMCMNLQLGGGGGICNESHKKALREGASKFAKEQWKNDSYRDQMISLFTEFIIKRHKDGKVNYSTTLGKNISQEHKNKIGEANKIKQRGILNSQYGTCWINNGFENKKIKKSDIIPDGWIYGRIKNKVKEQ